MPNLKNQQTVEKLIKKVSQAKSILLSDFKGIPTKDLEQFRSLVKDNGGEVLVSKNTLLKIALQEQGADSQVNSQLTGQTIAVLAYQDPVAVIKAFFDLRKTKENLKAKGGIFENKFVSEKQLQEISEIPARPVLLGRLLGSMKSPLNGFVGTLNQSKAKIVYAIKAVADQKAN